MGAIAAASVQHTTRPATQAPPNGQRLDDLLVAAAKKHGYLQTTPVAEALGIRRLKALKYLKWLVEEGRLAVVGEYKRRRYVPVEK